MFAMLYAGILMFTAWGGARLIGYSLDTRFCNEYLINWETAVRALAVTQVNWPTFNKNNHVAYMDRLVDMMQKADIPIPASNTVRPYVYRIKKIGDPENKLFVLCLPNRIIVYGLSDRTFKTVDVSIDGGFDLHKGQFTGYPAQDGLTYTGRWQL